MSARARTAGVSETVTTACANAADTLHTINDRPNTPTTLATCAIGSTVAWL